MTSTISRRVYGKILRSIIENEFDPHDTEQQSGIFSINQVNEKKAATNREVHLLFVDFNKVYTIRKNNMADIRDEQYMNSHGMEQDGRTQRRKPKLDNMDKRRIDYDC